MLDGKMLRGLTGMPMRRKALANSSFADAEPEPFTFANLMTKSFVASILFMALLALRRLCLYVSSDAVDVQHGRDVIVLQDGFLLRDQPLPVFLCQLVLGPAEERVAFMHAGKEHVADPGRAQFHAIGLRLLQR